MVARQDTTLTNCYNSTFKSFKAGVDPSATAIVSWILISGDTEATGYYNHRSGIGMTRGYEASLRSGRCVSGLRSITPDKRYLSGVRDAVMVNEWLRKQFDE